MRSIVTRVSLFSLSLLLFISVPAYSATEPRTALVIGNGSYSSSPLANPVNDATVMASTLQRLGFDVILKKNAQLQDMEDSIREFGDRLRKGGVGLFFYAGHGVQVAGKNYLIPVAANVSRETDVRYKAVDADMILDEMGSAGNNMNIVILDACRDNPFGRSFRTASRGLAIVSSAPTGTFISYSTGPGKVAADGSGKNSPYTESLVKYMTTPGLPIEEVFKKVRQDIGKMTKGQQVPWELSSLEGQFFFNRQGTANLSSDSESILREKEALERERQDVARQKEELERQKALAAEREQLAAERRKLEAESQQLAMGKRPSVSPAGETARDGRFIAYDNGTVLDTRTNLMWPAKDNGADINWSNAKSYCENYRGGGYSDWRMPTQGELAGLYDVGKTQRNEAAPSYPVHITELIDLTSCCPWSSETRGSEAAYFGFILTGNRLWNPQSGDITGARALPVRSAGAAFPQDASKSNPTIVIKTSKGVIEALLFKDKAPITVENFIRYIDAKHYDGTVFHRVIKDFMIQGGGFDQNLSQRATQASIKNEADNGLKNERGTLAMARTGVVDSATAQFFINLGKNAFLDHGSRDFGYAVFGKVTKGMDVVDAIAGVQTGARGPFPKDCPLDAVIIESIRVK